MEPRNLPPRAEIVIVGASVAGAATARALALAGREVLLLDQRPAPDARRLAGEMMMPHGAGSLARLGLLPRLRAAGAQDVVGFACWEAPGAAPVTLNFAARPDGLPAGGVTLHHHALVAALQAGAEDTPGVTRVTARATGVLRQGDRVTGVVVESAGQQHTVAADLVVGADGRFSAVRKWLELPYELVQPSLSLGVAVPRSALPFPDRGHVFLGAWGPCLAYPVGPGDARVIVDLPDGSRPGPALRERVRTEHAPVFPAPQREAVEAGLAREDVRFHANHHVTVPRIAVPGAVLVGDARGILHPLTAAGMTLCFNDAEILAGAVGGQGPIPLARLRAYEARRLVFTWARFALGDALHDVFSGATPALAALRAAVFAYWRADAAGRGRTLALLSGYASSPLALAGEYGRVLARALVQSPALAPALLRQAARHATGVAAAQ